MVARALPPIVTSVPVAASVQMQTPDFVGGGADAPQHQLGLPHPTSAFQSAALFNLHWK